MSRSILTAVSLVCGLMLIVVAGPTGVLAGAPAGAEPEPTAVAFRSIIPGVRDWGTPDQFQRRSGLSIVKLYIADYALRHGDHIPSDQALAERMVRFSDDGAADQLAGKYPQAVAATAAEYRLTATSPAGYWGNTVTSVADMADFLRDKLTGDPLSPILTWMSHPGPVATDGTRQNWGTSRVPGVLGTKWGWSSYGPQQVASASWGTGFTLAAHTFGSPDRQNADVHNATHSWFGVTGAPTGSS